ncbi:hypothetical protein ACFL1N_09145 [Thermodesulfobacteriota bacterium]
MSALFTFKQIIKALANTSMPLVCVIVITLLTISCSTVPTKQTTSTDTAANSLTTKEKSDNKTTENIQKELECRYIEVTGSRFKKKICKSKEAWAKISKRHKSEADEFVRGITEKSGISTSGETDPAGGRMNTPTTPPGGF